MSAREPRFVNRFRRPTRGVRGGWEVSRRPRHFGRVSCKGVMELA